MRVNHLLAVVPVSDIEAAARWYERFLGGAPTNQPMPSLVEWQTTSTGWRAGHTAMNFAVDDLEAAVNELIGRGLAPGEIQTANKGVQLSALTDPDGNTITLIGGFREIY
jgi:glyoxylase I family protein